MQSKLRLPLQKKYPPKLSQEQLRERTNLELKNHGVDNHLQAKINYQTCEAIIQSDNQIFNSIKPHPRPCHKTMAWKIALEFIYDFMKQNKLIESYKTTHLEMTQVGDPKSTGFFAQHERNIYFQKLLQTAGENAKKSFADRLQEFRKQQALVPPPELTLDPITSPSTVSTARGFAKDSASHGSQIKSRSIDQNSVKSKTEPKTNTSSKGFHFTYTNPTGEPNTATKSLQMGEEAAKIYNNNDSTTESAYSDYSKEVDEKTPEKSPQIISKQEQLSPKSSDSHKDSYMYTVSDPEAPKKPESPKESPKKEGDYSYSGDEKPPTPQQPQTPPKKDTAEYSYSYTPDVKSPEKQQVPPPKEHTYSEYSDENLESRTDDKKPPSPKKEYNSYTYSDIDEKTPEKPAEVPPKGTADYSYTYSDEQKPNPVQNQESPKKPDTADYSYTYSQEPPAAAAQNPPPKQEEPQYYDYYSDEEPQNATPQKPPQPKDTYTYEEFDDTPKKSKEYSYESTESKEKRQQNKEEAVYSYSYSDGPAPPAAQPAPAPANDDYSYTYSDENIDSTYH